MFVYLIKNLITGKCYVGQTRRTLVQRFNSHKKVVGRSNACKALSDAMMKYGTENFSIEPLCKCESQDEMDRQEIRFIAELNTFSPGGYNLTRGGGGKSGYKHSAESVEKMAASHRGKPLTEEHKQKVSDSLRGNKRALGMRHSEETRRALSAMQKGLKRGPMNQSHREALAAARIGSKASEATKKKMSKSHSKRYTVTLPLEFKGRAVNLQQLADMAGCTRSAMQQRIRTLKLTPEQAVAMGRTKTRSEALLIAHYGRRVLA